MKYWLISDLQGNIVGKLQEDEADDATDAKLNWADENLDAQLLNENQLPISMQEENEKIEGKKK